MAEWTPQVDRLGEGERDQIVFAQSLLKEKRFDEALDQFAQVLTRNSRSMEALLGIARVHYRRKEFEQAARHYEEAAKIDPFSAQTWLRAALSHLRAQNLKEAQRAFESSVQINPKDPRGRIGLAQVLLKQGEGEEAAAHLKEALRLAPDDHRARAMLSRIYGQTGNLGMAISELEYVVRVKPDQRPAMVQLSRLYSKTDDYPRAVDALKSATKIAPENTRVWRLLGQANMQMREHEAAEAAFREASRLEAGGVATKLQFVDVLIEQNKLDEARQVLEEIPRRGKLTPMLYRLNGEILRRKGYHREAVEAYRAALLNGAEDGPARVASIEGPSTAGKEVDWVKLAETYRPVMVQLVENLREEMKSRAKDRGRQKDPSSRREALRRTRGGQRAG